MFNDLINTASRQLCAARESVCRLGSMTTRALPTAAQMTTGDLKRLGDTLGTLEHQGVRNMEKSTASLVSAGDILTKGLTGGIEAGRALRALSAASATLRRIGIEIPSFGQNANALFRAAGQVTRLGESLQAALPSVNNAMSRVSQSLTALFGGSSSGLPLIELTAASAGDLVDVLNAAFVNAHLLILITMETPAKSYFFNLSTAAYDNLRRQTSYNIARQDRLTRLPALQAVAKGEDTITVSGAIFTKQSGPRQLTRLREIGFSMVPILLTTGYGEVFGQFYVSRIEEEQSGLFADGMPRRQSFTLEFQRYGEDYSNV